MRSSGPSSTPVLGEAAGRRELSSRILQAASRACGSLRVSVWSLLVEVRKAELSVTSRFAKLWSPASVNLTVAG